MSMDGKKTYTGIIIAALGLLMHACNINITKDELQPLVNMGLELAGLIFATYGRVKVKPKDGGNQNVTSSLNSPGSTGTDSNPGNNPVA